MDVCLSTQHTQPPKAREGRTDLVNVDDDGHLGVLGLDLLDDAALVRGGEDVVVERAQVAGPRVEHLDDLRAGLDLEVGVGWGGSGICVCVCVCDMEKQEKTRLYVYLGLYDRQGASLLWRPCRTWKLA